MEKIKNSDRVLGVYEITYLENGFVQTKSLISEYNFNNILKPIKNAIKIIEDDNRGKENEQSQLLKQSLKLMFGDYNECFTEDSPMGKSIKTGIILLPPQQGGEHKVTWKRIK
jgi:hypothetical protein